MSKCKSCGHEHQGKRLAYICIGCPCPMRPGEQRDKVEPPCGSHPVDVLMGRDGDALLATGTRSMWIALFERHTAELRAPLAAFEAREPLVQALVERVGPPDEPYAPDATLTLRVQSSWVSALEREAAAVRDFPLQPSAAPAEQKPVDGGVGKMLADDAAGFKLNWKEAEALCAEVRRLRAELRHAQGLRSVMELKKRAADAEAERDRMKTDVRHWREECGKVNSQARAYREAKDESVRLRECIAGLELGFEKARQDEHEAETRAIQMERERDEARAEVQKLRAAIEHAYTCLGYPCESNVRVAFQRLAEVSTEESGP